VRRTLSTLLVAAAVLAWSAAPAAAQTLNISFRSALIKPNSTCEGLFCSPVTVPGYGDGTLTFTDDSFEPISRSCIEYTSTVRIEFVDPAVESIVMSESGVACFPGNSFNAPGGARSYGNPFHQTGTFEVTSGPAELVGLTGTSRVRVAGADVRGTYSTDPE
jgi:hypothetical protein